MLSWCLSLGHHDISRINDADQLTESITVLRYQRHQAVFACHMEDIRFHKTVSKEVGEFLVGWPCHRYLNCNEREGSQSCERMNVQHAEAQKQRDRKPSLQDLWFFANPLGVIWHLGVQT